MTQLFRRSVAAFVVFDLSIACAGAPVTPDAPPRPPPTPSGVPVTSPPPPNPWSDAANLLPPPTRMRSTPECPATCQGSATTELKLALVAGAGRTKRCYHDALRRDPALAGRALLWLRISPQGGTCRATLDKVEFADEEMKRCILELAREMDVPAPTGGCVDVVVPLSFRPTPTADAGADGG